MKDLKKVHIEKNKCKEYNLREFAFHMKNRKTNEEKIKKVKSTDSIKAHCRDVKYGTDWIWIGTEPFKNIEDKVYHVGIGYYKYKEE